MQYSENGSTLKRRIPYTIDAIKEGSRIDYIYTDPKISYPLEESVEAINEGRYYGLGPKFIYQRYTKSFSK